MVYDALKEQARKTCLRSNYVFLNEEETPIEIETLRKNAWSKGLKRAGLLDGLSICIFRSVNGAVFAYEELTPPVSIGLLG